MQLENYAQSERQQIEKCFDIYDKVHGVNTESSQK